MELYGLYPTLNGSQPGYQLEWNPAGPETGLEESMRQLSVTGIESYPERPGVADCVYYMRTGYCGYGNSCRYNHPRDRAAVEAAVRATGEYPERPEEPICQFYLKTGTCKYGASCKFHHPKHGGGSLSHVSLNIYGYPLRPGEKECSYYLKTGQCIFGITCKFHHPQPAGTSMPSSAPQFYQPVQSPSVPIPEQYGGASTNVRVARPPPLAPVLSPGAQPAVGATSPYGLTQLSSSTPSFAGPYPLLTSKTDFSSSNQKEHTFPQRTGEPECQYYLKTGDCKFGSSCRYHHPRDRVVPQTNCILSPMGLPLRPGVQPCAFYLQNGHCKFGSTCKFDHPIGTMRNSP
ncbi:Zinc finger CCCH domain-containing protein 32 [Hibiscus syriacus]|uniref:Zinc finger CCCH domain-containing protein 32 n=1 Tax=Hibiscus syriacus TaxID=106335 RepID=A0A6A2YRK6_HIBSY|nr:Zinc finger CCCH domain-containing protein 32 [Hibiscus syriacus]